MNKNKKPRQRNLNLVPRSIFDFAPTPEKSRVKPATETQEPQPHSVFTDDSDDFFELPVTRCPSPPPQPPLESSESSDNSRRDVAKDERLLSTGDDRRGISNRSERRPSPTASKRGVWPSSEVESAYRSRPRDKPQNPFSMPANLPPPPPPRRPPPPKEARHHQHRGEEVYAPNNQPPRRRVAPSDVTATYKYAATRSKKSGHSYRSESRAAPAPSTSSKLYRHDDNIDHRRDRRIINIADTDDEEVQEERYPRRSSGERLRYRRHPYSSPQRSSREERGAPPRFVDESRVHRGLYDDDDEHDEDALDESRSLPSISSDESEHYRNDYENRHRRNERNESRSLQLRDRMSGERPRRCYDDRFHREGGSKRVPDRDNYTYEDIRSRNANERSRTTAPNNDDRQRRREDNRIVRRVNYNSNDKRGRYNDATLVSHRLTAESKRIASRHRELCLAGRGGGGGGGGGGAGRGGGDYLDDDSDDFDDFPANLAPRYRLPLTMPSDVDTSDGSDTSYVFDAASKPRPPRRLRSRTAAKSSAADGRRLSEDWLKHEGKRGTAPNKQESICAWLQSMDSCKPEVTRESLRSVVDACSANSGEGVRGGGGSGGRFSALKRKIGCLISDYCHDDNDAITGSRSKLSHLDERAKVTRRSRQRPLSPEPARRGGREIISLPSSSSRDGAEQIDESSEWNCPIEHSGGDFTNSMETDDEELANFVENVAKGREKKQDNDEVVLKDIEEEVEEVEEETYEEKGDQDVEVDEKEKKELEVEEEEKKVEMVDLFTSRGGYDESEPCTTDDSVPVETQAHTIMAQLGNNNRNNNEDDDDDGKEEDEKEKRITNIMLAVHFSEEGGMRDVQLCEQFTTTSTTIITTTIPTTTPSTSTTPTTTATIPTNTTITSDITTPSTITISATTTPTSTTPTTTTTIIPGNTPTDTTHTIAIITPISTTATTTTSTAPTTNTTTATTTIPITNTTTATTTITATTAPYITTTSATKTPASTITPATTIPATTILATNITKKRVNKLATDTRSETNNDSRTTNLNNESRTTHHKNESRTTNHNKDPRTTHHNNIIGTTHHNNTIRTTNPNKDSRTNHPNKDSRTTHHIINTASQKAQCLVDSLSRAPVAPPVSKVKPQRSHAVASTLAGFKDIRGHTSRANQSVASRPSEHGEANDIEYSYNVPNRHVSLFIIIL